MKELGYGKNYRYPHDEPDAFAKGVRYFPDHMPIQHYYQPSDRGLEAKIKAKLSDIDKH